MAFISGRPSTYGEPFLLPLDESCHVAAKGAPRYQIQRAKRREVRCNVQSNAISALNSLVASRAGTPLLRGCPRAVSSLLEVSSTQRSVLARVASRVADMGPCPAGLGEPEALRELLHSSDIYDLCEVSTRQELDFDKLKVVKDCFVSIGSRRLVAPQHLCLIDEPHRYVLRSAADMEVVSTEPTITPFWCSSSQCSKIRRIEFYQMLFSVGLL